MSSTVQARSEKRTSQESTCLEKTVQDQLEINPQLEEEKSSDDGEMFQSFLEDQGEGNRTPEELFLEHFTAEPVRDEILENTTSYQEVITTPDIHQQEEWQDLKIVEDVSSRVSKKQARKGGIRKKGSATSSEETRSTNLIDRRSE